MHFPVTSGNGAALHLLQAGDAGEMAAAYLRNRAHLAPWEPERPEEFFTPAGQRRTLDIQLDSLAAALAYPAVGPPNAVCRSIMELEATPGIEPGYTVLQTVA